MLPAARSSVSGGGPVRFNTDVDEEFAGMLEDAAAGCVLLGEEDEEMERTSGGAGIRVDNNGGSLGSGVFDGSWGGGAVGDILISSSVNESYGDGQTRLFLLQ